MPQVQDNTQFFIRPENPGPNELVGISIEDYSKDLDSLDITWFLNGVVQKKGGGLKNFEFITKGLGSVSKIKISTGSSSKEITIRPTKLGLMWQTNNYTPPFYKGRALYTYQSRAQVIAIPSFVTSSGATLDPKTLVYKWSVNGSALGKNSGYGKNVLPTGGWVLAKPVNISVVVTSTDGNFKAENSISLGGSVPQVLVYENHPLYGVLYNTAIPSAFTLNSKEISFFVAPYFFNTNKRDNALLAYKWKMNGRTIPNQTNPYSLVLRIPDGQVGGEASVGIGVQKTDDTLQYAEFSTRIHFNADNADSTQTI
ncbi:hypothetical protein EXS61_02405 [Candidatus Parcubacteria bacterium]|nr:hypothetical protein [Candidatus Parcubacteria bacterium]